MAERPLYTLYKNLKAQNYDVPDDYDKFESALTRDGKGGADNRHAIYENLKAQNFDVPNTYERFYSALFEPRSKTSSRAKGGSIPMTAADRARFSAGAAAISASAQHTMNNAGRYNKLKQRKQRQRKDFGRVNLGTHQTPYGGDANNVVKDDFAYNPETGKTGAYVSSDNENVYSQPEAEQKQNLLDKYGEEWNNAVDMGIVPSELDKADPDLSDTDVAMRQMERRQEWLNENQNRRSNELNESMHLQGSPFVASGGAVAPSSFNAAISNEANRLSDVEYGAYNTAKAYNQMLRTTLLQELKEQKQRNENAGWWKDKWNDVSNYFGAMFNTMLDPKLYSQGVMDAAISNNLLQVKKGMEDGTIKKGSNAGNAAQAMLGAIQQQQGEAAKQQQYGTKAYQYGDMSGRSLKFMGDFALSGWRNVMTTGFTKAGEKVGEKMALGALGKWFTKNTGRVLGDIAGSAALAATNQLGSTYNNVIERYVGMNNENGGVTQDKNGDLKFNEGVSLGKAIKDGFGSATIENFSEMFGEYLPGAPKLLSKLGLSKVSSFFEKIGNNAYYKWLSNATNKSGIQGVMAEISEEEFGTALHAAWGDGDGSWSDFNVFTNPDAREKQIDTCLGMFYSVGFMQAPRTAVGAINAVQYFNIKHQVAKADKFGQVMFNDKWDEIKSKIDVTTNADLTKTVLDATRSDSMTAKQKGAVINYAMFLSKLRGFNQAADAKTKDKVEEGDTAPTLSNELDDAYTEGHNADDTDKHNIQLEQNDKANELAAMLHITPEQLHDMADEDLEAMTGQDDKLDKAIYDYQLSTAKYQGVMDGAQDEVDMAAHQAAMETDNMTDLSRGTVRKATIKATGGAEDYEVYIISGNIATHDDGSIDVGNSDDMIIYYDPTTGRKEHADAMMFADLIEELPAADVKTQAINDAKENAIKKIAGIVDGTVDVGSQFSITDADGTEHTYEVLADNGDGTAMITIDGNVAENPYSLADLQQMKDLEDQKRLEAAKAEREQMEKEHAAQQTQEVEETQPSFDFNQILNDDGNVVLVDVLDEDGNTKYPDSKLFLIRDTGAKAKVVEMKSDGTFVPHAVSKKNVATISSMTLDEYKQAMAETSMIEENSGAIEGDRGGIEVNDELPPVPDNVTINGDGTYSVDGAVQSGENNAAPAEQTEQTPAMTLEDGTIVPMLEDGNPDFSKLTADQTAELYDSQFGEDADSVISGWVSDAKKALDKANNMTVKGKNFVEQKAAKEAKEKAIADAQAAYDSAIAIRDAYNSRQLAKVEDDADGRKNLIEKARRKYNRLKSAVKDDAEAVSQLYKDVVGSLLHRLYDGTGIDVTDTIPLTAEEYVASNLGAHSLNYEGTETSKGVKQETGLSREDFAKTQLLAADGKGTTIDDLVHSLWENRPSNLESLDTQDIRNALIGVLTSGFKASEARNYVENLRIAQAENFLEEQKKAADNAAFAEQQTTPAEQQTETAPESEEKTEEENSDEINDEENEKINEQTNENINAPEVPEDATAENPMGAQLDQTDLPFSAKENGTQQTTAERAADVEKNKVDDMKVVDNIVGQKTRKAFERLAKMMGADIQWQYSDKLGNGWIQETTDADGNIHRTIFITLDSSITEGAQFIFGHEMTHQIKNLNPAAYNELTQLVIDTYGADAYDKAIDETMKRYSDAGFSGRARDYYAEEVVADAVGEMIRDLNLAHTLAMKMSHPLLAAIHEILQKIKLAFYGTEYSDVTKNIIRSIEQAYVKTAKGEVTNSETGEDVSFSLRQKPEPKKKGIGYKVFVLKDGKLYPPMVANPDGAATPVGVWLDADAAPIAGESKTGRPQVKQGGKGTQGGSGKLAYRPGWHLGVVPYAIQFNRKDAEGNKILFPKNFVFAEVEYAADVDYQEEARQEGINPSGKYQHSLAGLKHLPTDGYYMYRTNPNPETDPWVITGAMKVNRILTRAEQAELVKNAGREPQKIQEGDIVTDDVVNSINQEIADAPKFSLKVYHGSGADFTEFDFDHMGEGAGSQTFGWGGYVTSSKKIGKSYANLVDANAPHQDVEYVGNNAYEYTDVVAGLFNGGQRDYDDVKEFLQNGYNADKQNARKKQMLEWFESTKPSDWKSVNDGKRNLYEVDIPDDNGNNYLDFENPMSEEQINTIREALAKKGVDVPSWEKRGFKLDLPFKDVYAAVLPMMMRCEPKEVSKFLSSLGYTGIKYPAGTIMGGAEEGDTNYVIFKPEDMRITEHTKFSLRLKSAIDETETNPSDAQKESGNYKKGHIKFGGYDYTIENPKGSIRSGKDADGKEWKVTMHDTYGYIRGKYGKDGDHLDMFINDKADLDNWNGDVFVVDQVNPDGSFDEHKVMYGFDSMDDAENAYRANYSKGWKGLGSITRVSKDEFDKWLDTSNRKLKPFADYVNVKFSQVHYVSEPRFSLKDEKTLAGVHNITEEKLRKALKLGGFANPSLAVIDTSKSGHDNFGEISFIAPFALLDKRTGKTGGTWITDAYTQRYPSVEREMSEKGSQKFRDWVDSLEYPSEAKAEIKRQAEDALSNNNAPAWELMYLKEKGIDIKEYDSRIDYRWKEIIKDHPTVEDILNSMNTDPELNEKVTGLAKHIIVDPIRGKISLEVRRKIYKETGVKMSSLNPQVRKQTNEIFDRDYKSTLLDKDGKPKAEDVKKVVEQMVKEHNDTKKYNFYLSKVKASNYVNKNGLYDDYIKWQENKLDEFGTKNRIFRGYTKDGSRKYVPETLENVSKVMREEADGQTNGSEYTSFGSFIAKLASRVDSTDEMRANKDKLSSNEDKEEFYEKWSSVYYDLAKFLYDDVFYGEQRLHDIVLQSDPKKYAKKEYGITLTPTFMKKLDALKNAVQTELKSAYFETKYNRPLRLNEFAAAVVPDSLGEDVRKGIEDAGLPMYDYDPNKEGDRSRAFNEAINSSDNIRFSLKEEKEKIVADAKANGTYMTAPNGEKTKLDAEQWATVRTANFKNWFGDWENDPENASKVVDENGEPMVVWHGRSAEFNTFEKKEGVRFIMGLEDKVKAEGFFFSPDKGLAEEFASNSSRHRGGKANVVPCFLNIRKPMDLTGEDYDRIYEDVTGWEYMVGMDTQDNLWGIMDEEGMADKIKEKGYDGAIFVEEVDDSYEPTKISYCALDANQIKSAENNNGDFSADNNDIRFSLKSMMEKPGGWKQANKKAIHIAEAIERDPKFSLKNLDGTLIKAGTYFSGGGLVEEGLKGIIDPVVAVEYDEKISGVYRNNFGQHIVTADVRDVDPKELVKQIDGEVEYFHASPVCKNYSQAKSNHAEVELDKKTAASTAEFINAVKPKVVTIENVKGYKDSEAMKTITDALDANGYTWDADVYNAADYGGYTNRERLIVRAVRDGKLPEKPKKMAHKSGWYEAVADIIPTLTEKKNGVAPWMDVRLKADGIDWRNIDKPLYVMGSAYADGKVPHAFADELLPTLRTKSGDVIVMPDGKVYRAMGRVLARVSGVSDDYKMPFSENLSHTIIGNGIPTQLTEHVIAPLLTGSDPKFSIRTYHGTGASFDKFDFSHMGEGEGTQAFGWGGYVTSSQKIGKDYADMGFSNASARRFSFNEIKEIDERIKGESLFKNIGSDERKRLITEAEQYLKEGFDDYRGATLKEIISFVVDDAETAGASKEVVDILKSINVEDLYFGDRNLYEVDIPDDNGSNYLDWDKPLSKKQQDAIREGLVRLGVDMKKLEGKGQSLEKTGENVYNSTLYIGLSGTEYDLPERTEGISKFLSFVGFTGIKYKAGRNFGGAKKGDTNYVIFNPEDMRIIEHTKFSLRYDKFEHDLNQWKKDNNLPKDAQRPTIPQRNAGESAAAFLKRVDEYRKQMALWKTAPTYEQHLLSDDTALGEFNRELQRGSVLKRIAFQDSMLAIRKAQEAIMKEVGVDRLNMAEDAYTAENRSHGKGKNEFEEYNNEFLQPLRKAYHQMKKVLGDSYDNVRVYMMAKHGLERDAQMAFKKSLEADYEDVNQRSAAYKAYKNDLDRVSNDADLEFGRVDFTTWRQKDNALRGKYSPSYMDYRYDDNGIAYDYSGLSSLFDGSDFEEAAHKLVRDVETKHLAEVQALWNATNAATKKILRDGFKAGMMSKEAYEYVKGMYSNYIPLRGWDGTTADQVWDYIGGGKGAFNQTLKTAHGRTSIADDPIAYIENMAESGILLNNKNWVKQHLMLLAQNHPTSLLTLSKAWYVKSTDANGNEEWIPATPQITSQMNSNQVKTAIDAFEQKMEQMAQTGDATQQRNGLNIAYPQTHSEEREHEVRVMKDGEEYVIYVNGDPQLAQAMNNTRAHRVREIQSGKLDRAAAWLGRKMAAAYTSLSPLFIPSNYFRDLTMTLASTAIREDAKYNYLLRKNLATSWNLGFMLRDYQNGKLREKVSNGNATAKEQMFYDFMMNGGETGFVSSLDVEDLKKKFKNDLKDLDRWKANPVKVGHTIMDGIEFLNRAIEDSNRFAVYMTSIQYGRSIDEAVNDAKDVTLNFNRKGTGEYGWQMIRNLYLFINPAVQSLQTLGALVKHHPFKFTAVTAAWLASGVLVPIVNAALMSLLGGDDDKDKYWQFSKWDRRNNAIMWIPFTNEYVKIPLAQEFRAFYGIGDMIASKMMGGELAEETWSQYAEDMLGQVVDMLPLDPTGYDGNIAVSLMPNAIRPVFELAFNVDFTGKPLFKDTEYNKYDPNFTKAYVGTPDWLVRASRMMNSIGNDYPDVQQNKWDALGNPRYSLNNPAVVDHVLSSYLGGAYTMGSQVLGLLTKSLNDKKEIKMADIPVLSKFVSNPDDRPVSKKQGDEFWDKKEFYDRAVNTISKLKKQAKIDGDYSLLERFYGSEEYKKYKLYEKDVNDYKEARKKERAEESGDEYRPHQLNAEDIYKNHATPMDEFEDMKLKQLFEKLNSFKTRYDAIVDNAPNESEGYYNTNKAAIDAIDEISLDKQEISELKKGFLDDGKDAYNAEDMKRIRELRKRILSVLEPANKVVVARQKAMAEKK